MSRVFVFTKYGSAAGQELIERPVPQPGPGQLAVSVRAAGVNPVDWKIREGRFGQGATLPVPMGREVAGVVTALGADVTGFAVGDAVLGPVAKGQGGFADDTLINASDAVAKPEDISFEMASVIPVAGTTAFDVTHDIELEPGQTAVVLGAGGGVGNMASQIGRVHKFRVIGVASEAKREAVEATGATFVAAGPDAAAQVKALVPEGADLLVDLVGGQPLRDLAGVAKSPKLIISAADAASAEELGGQGRKRLEGTLEKITGVIGYGVVTPEISKSYPLDQAADALAAVEQGHAGGKIVLVP